MKLTELTQHLVANSRPILARPKGTSLLATVLLGKSDETVADETAAKVATKGVAKANNRATLLSRLQPPTNS
jgi:hypothetical protein